MGAAIEDDADDPMALAAGGFVLAFLGADREVALASIARAAAVNPASATVASLGAHANHPDEAGAYAARALSLSPSHPLAFEAHLGLGLRAEIEERWDNAAACTARAVQVDPGFGSGYLPHAIALAWPDAPSPPAPRSAAASNSNPLFAHACLRIPDPAREKTLDGCRKLHRRRECA